MIHTYQIIEAQPCHIRALAAVLRLEDRAELLAAGESPRRVLWNSYRRAVVRKAALIDGDIAAAWGCNGPLFAPVGTPWLLTSDTIERMPMAFVREARREAAEMLDFFPLLVNYVHASYGRAIGFLRILGFVIEPPAPLGPMGAMFCRFTLSRET